MKIERGYVLCPEARDQKQEVGEPSTNDSAYIHTCRGIN